MDFGSLKCASCPSTNALMIGIIFVNDDDNELKTRIVDEIHSLQLCNSTMLCTSRGANRLRLHRACQVEASKRNAECLLIIEDSVSNQIRQFVNNMLEKTSCVVLAYDHALLSYSVHKPDNIHGIRAYLMRSDRLHYAANPQCIWNSDDLDEDDAIVCGFRDDVVLTQVSKMEMATSKSALIWLAVIVTLLVLFVIAYHHHQA